MTTAVDLTNLPRPLRLPSVERWNAAENLLEAMGTRSLLLLLPAAVAFIGFVLFVYGDLTGKHWIRAGGAAIGGAAVLMAVAGWLWSHRADGGSTPSR